MTAVADITERILAQIARATSKRPARATDIAALVGGDDAAFLRALEQLVDERRVVTAYIQRPRREAEPWLAIWPTGIHKAPGGWTGNAHTHLFVPTAPRREAEHNANAPRVRPADRGALA